MTVKKPSAEMQSWNEVVQAVERAIRIGAPDFYNTRIAHIGLKNYAYRNSNDPWRGDRPSWFPGVRASLMMKNEVSGLAINGEVPVCTCDACDIPCSFQGIEIDHLGGYNAIISSWKDGANDITRGEARILYNNPEKLRATCAVCNSSHPEIKNIANSTALAQRRNARERMMALFGDYVSSE